MNRSPEFPPEEFEHRVGRAQNLMREAEIDCLLITNDRNFFYFTGFDGVAQLARPRPLLIPSEGSPVIFIAPNYVTTISDATWISDIRVYAGMTQAPVEELVETIRNFPILHHRIGAELGYEQRLGVTYADIELMKREGDEFDIVDASRILWQLRMVKTPLEIEMLTNAMHITDNAFPKAFAQVKEGMTEKEIRTLFIQTLHDCGADSGSASVITGDGDYFRSMALPRDRPVERGEMVWVDLGAKFNGYCSDFSRAGIIGKPTTEQIDLQEKIQEVTMLGVEAILPGSRMADITRLLNQEMEKRNLVFNSGAMRYGHGIGLVTTEPPHLAAYDNTIIEPGMVLSIEPAMITEFGRFCVEQNIIVTASGVTRHSLFGHELIALD